MVVELQLGGWPESDLLSAAAEVVAEVGPEPNAVLSAMSRGLDRRRGSGTWDAIVVGLIEAASWRRHQAAYGHATQHSCCQRRVGQ
jgi:hypothetical protein